MTKFSGMFIGGTRDGQEQEATHPVIRIHTEDQGNTASQQVWGEARWGDQPSDGTAPQTEEYTHLSLWGFDRGFWIPSEEAEKGVISANSYVIENLSQRYAEKS